MHDDIPGDITPGSRSHSELIVQAPIKARQNRGAKKKCVNYKGLWDLIIPSELLQEIFLRLGLKANIQASVVCKTWYEEAVSVKRKLHPPVVPWLFYLQYGLGEETYTLFDPSKSQTYIKTFPELKNNEIFCSRDGWLLTLTYSSSKLVFFLNPFTKERINLPEKSRSFSGYCFSAAPTSSSCVVVSFKCETNYKYFVVSTWRPGESVWTIHRFKKQTSSGIWYMCVFSNDVFYLFSNLGYLSVFDPRRATWNIVPVKPWSCPGFCDIKFCEGSPLLMEHEGDIFVMDMRVNTQVASFNNIPQVFKLNFKRMVWEKKKDVGGLTVFVSSSGSNFIRAGLSVKERDRVYPSSRCGHSYHLGGEESFRLPISAYLFNHVVWVDPPHNNVNL